MALLVDSSVWIAARRRSSKEYFRLQRLLKGAEEICITRFIQNEVCQGAKTEEFFARLWDGFRGFPILEIIDNHWEKSAHNYFRCRRVGLTVTTLDCLLATLAQEYRVCLWTLDKSFIKMQPIIGFDLA